LENPVLSQSIILLTTKRGKVSLKVSVIASIFFIVNNIMSTFVNKYNFLLLCQTCSPWKWIPSL